jgi:delta14-sterol reductase
MFAWFLIEYLLCEEIHLYTYDLFAEKLGFKLSWGCLVLYPFFNCIGCYHLVTIPLEKDISITQIIIILTTFFTGWIITRGANMQKFYYRKYPNNDTFLFGLIRQATIPESRILCSGYWGLARHFNYFGEILQAIALALPGFLLANDYMHMIIPMLYPLYYTILFVTREIDDNAVCQKKYGKYWNEYCKKVPSRIVPGIY